MTPYFARRVLSAATLAEASAVTDAETPFTVDVSELTVLDRAESAFALAVASLLIAAELVLSPLVTVAAKLDTVVATALSAFALAVASFVMAAALVLSPLVTVAVKLVTKVDRAESADDLTVAS